MLDLLYNTAVCLGIVPEESSTPRETEALVCTTDNIPTVLDMMLPGTIEFAYME